MLRFQQDFPGLELIRLPRTYRCSPHVLGAAQALLASSPPLVAFRYKASAEQPEGSREAATLDVLRHPRDWVAAGGGGASSASREGDSAAAAGGGRE